MFKLHEYVSRFRRMMPLALLLSVVISYFRTHTYTLSDSFFSLHSKRVRAHLYVCSELHSFFKTRFIHRCPLLSSACPVQRSPWANGSRPVNYPSFVAENLCGFIFRGSTYFMLYNLRSRQHFVVSRLRIILFLDTTRQNVT